MLNRRLVDTLEIAAPVEAVWALLTDFASYPQWNPFVPEALGEARVGQRLTIRLRLGKRRITLHPRVTRVDRPRELRWRAKWGASGWFDVDRGFLMERTGQSRTRLWQEEVCSGLLAPLVFALSNAERDILAGYRGLARALKERAELGQRASRLSS